MSTEPDRFRVCIWDRVNVSSRRERKTSSRKPRSSGPAWSFIPKYPQGEHDHAGRNSRIGDIERGPVEAADVEFEEVDYVSKPDAVVQIAQRSSENEAQRPLHEPGA